MSVGCKQFKSPIHNDAGETADADFKENFAAKTADAALESSVSSHKAAADKHTITRVEIVPKLNAEGLPVIHRPFTQFAASLII